MSKKSKIIDGRKNCTKCDKLLELDKFNKDKRQLSGYKCRCKKCLAVDKKKWKKKNIDKVRKHSREYRRKYSKTINGIYGTLLLRKERVGVSISLNDFTEWYQAQSKKCCYCGIPEEELINDGLQFGRNVRRLTIDRKNNLLGYENGNLVLACYMCNFVKGNIFNYEEMLKIGDMIKKKRKSRPT